MQELCANLSRLPTYPVKHVRLRYRLIPIQIPRVWKNASVGFTKYSFTLTMFLQFTVTQQRNGAHSSTSGNLFSHPWRRTHKRELIPQCSGPNRILRVTSVRTIKQNSELSRAYIPLANLTLFEVSTEQFFPPMQYLSLPPWIRAQMKDACPTSDKQIDIRWYWR